jgi:uncharacterized membrane protein HdeD (DUF308 family)
MHILSRNQAQASRQAWWASIALGLFAIIFGIVAIVWPHLTFLLFLIIFGVYAIIEGLVLIASALYVRRAPELGDYSNAAMPPGGWLIVLGEGVLSIIAGLLCLFIPRLSAQVSLYVVATWALFAGISSLVHARSRGWFVGIAGIAAIVISLFLFVRTVASARSILWLVGVLALVAGALLIVQGWLDRPMQEMQEMQDEATVL